MYCNPGEDQNTNFLAVGSNALLLSCITVAGPVQQDVELGVNAIATRRTNGSRVYATLLVHRVAWAAHLWLNCKRDAPARALNAYPMLSFAHPFQLLLMSSKIADRLP